MIRRLSPRALLSLTLGLVLAVLAVVAGVLLTRGGQPSKVALPLRVVKEIALPGDSSRFDYASLDPDRGLLFIAHLGASQVIEVDVRAGRVVRTIDGLPGVLVVPALHRVYATATDANEVVAVDETTGTVLHRSPTGDYPAARRPPHPVRRSRQRDFIDMTSPGDRLPPVASGRWGALAPGPGHGT
ncbi:MULTISPECIES: hypothetical protein [Streptomyces]|uniref:YncE family protein n=1 Tax=Streptomyces yunnanensis TaxID=156453 RepID=A0ABY8AHI3_9ACTN|nr:MULTISPECIES: hypothetical protein [Streptomyces]AJC60713.1 hypothetical protein GZL_08173 [Streptomyces sp. 769]WEB44500.1 hypothetical protein MOV08_37925 [Streptomyces yunnanensis]